MKFFEGIEKLFNLMFNSNPYLRPVILRWAGRVWSILPIFWAFAEIFYPHVSPEAEITTIEQISLVLLYICVGGLILAWVKERAGVLITLGSLVLFVIVFFSMGFDLDAWIFIVGLGVPAVLFFAAWRMETKQKEAEQMAEAV